MRVRAPLVSLVAASLASLSLADRHYDITNNCPSTITLYINGQSQGSLTKGSTTARDFPNTWSGFIYSDANGGNQNGSGTTRAGFFGDDNYYYIVVDPSHFNTGVSITPINRAPRGGFCLVDTCNSLTCSNAFQQPPTRFPPPTSTPPAQPLFECPQADTGYHVVFCPDGTFPGNPPSDNGVAVHPNGHNEKCLDVRGAVYANGTPVQIYDCNGTGAQKWVINRGNTKVRVAGRNFCLDAGTNPASGVGMKIWQCYDNLPAQAWYYTNDNRIAVTGKGQCLDLTNGVLTNSNRVQTWKCTDNNTNQIWTL